MISSILFSALILSALSAVLALIIIIADATIGNYGQMKLTVNTDKEFTVDGGRPLLVTLSDEGIFIPSACGGKGSCGLCKVTVESGVKEHVPTELPWLTEEEKTQNIHLACQCKVKTDVSIRIPEELFNVKEYETRVKSIRDLTHDIKEVIFELKNPDSIRFASGQFVQLQVPAYELTKEPVYRAYSMSSQPSRIAEVELEVRLVPNGVCTTYVHKYLKQGAKMTLNGPYGDFFLRDTQRDIVFIAGGSGMAPIKSMLNDMAEKGNNRNAKYFFGARSKRDLFLLEEMTELEKKLPNFSFIPALSEPSLQDNWTGATGLITEVLDRMVPTGENLEAYLCGSPGMIDACIRVLTAKQVPAELIYFDKFA